MSHRQPEKPHVLFLFSDTGGGHRSAAEAIIEAINLEYPDCMSTEMLDFFKEYAPPPLDSAPESYPSMAKMPEMWEMGYKLSNGRRRTRALHDLFWPYVRRASYRLIEEHPCDLYLSVHPIVNGALLRALGPDRPPYITVVTDLVSTHAFWYQRRSDLILVPTEEARQRGLDNGLDPEQMQVVGLPVAWRFCQPLSDRKALRTRLGWPQDRPIILLVGGGEGMGPVEKTAMAIASARFNAVLVVVCGRNRSLKAHLEEVDWPMPTIVYGYVTEMPNFMQAADVLVTKAGPGTICESFNAGLPIILFSRMPGQEDGNVSYVVNEGAGIWAPHSDDVVEALIKWLAFPEERLKAAAACRRLAKPDAARAIARIIADTLVCTNHVPVKGVGGEIQS